MDERRTGKTGTGWRPVLLKSGSAARGREEKEGSAWLRPRGGERRRRGGLARWSASRGGRQRPPTVGRVRRRCRANRGGQRAWETLATE
jgi:hypothetical protein